MTTPEEGGGTLASTKRLLGVSDRNEQQAYVSRLPRAARRALNSSTRGLQQSHAFSEFLLLVVTG